MAKIYCVRCGADTGYTDTTLVEDKSRSFIADGGDENHRVHFCQVCWDYHSGDKALELVKKAKL